MADALPSFLAPVFAQILDRCTPLWPQLRGQSLFITGGTGFFGRWLLETLHQANQQLALGLRVTVLTRDPARFLQQAPALRQARAFTFLHGNVRDFQFPSGDFTHVIHGATTSAHETYAGETPLQKFDTLVEGTRRVLDFAAERNVRHFLFTSSGAVYQPDLDAESMGTPESSLLAPPPWEPETALGQAKRAAEFLCACYAQQQGWQCAIARCFSFVGPWLPLNIHYAIGNFIQQALAHEDVIVHSDGRALRSYLFAGDLVVWLLTLLLQGTRAKPCNVGSDQAVSIGELAHLVRDTVNPQVNVRILGQANASVGNPARSVYVPDIRAARHTHALEVWTDLRTSVDITARHALHRHPASIPT
jgi:nucleoside-diphosphate-sugar epimerase